MTLPQPGWYADPSRSADLRWWDGSRWTDAVVQEGVMRTVPLPDARRPVHAGAPTAYAPEQGQAQGQGQHPAGAGSGGSLFTEPVLVVDQKAALVELTSEYAVRDQSGRRLGTVVQVGQSGLRKAVRLLSSAERFLTVRLEVRDAQGVPQLLVVRPATFVRSRVVVSRPGVGEVGQLVQENVLGRIRFGLHSGGRQVGSLDAQDWKAWDFSLSDDTGTEVARIRKTFAGVARALFTTADTYVVQVHRPLQDPLLSLVIASALTVDTVLEQDSRGLG